MSETTTTKTRGRPATGRKARPTRIPMSGQRMRMHIEEEDQDPAFHYAWITDKRGLLQRAKRAGFVHVTLDEIPSWGEMDIDAGSSDSSLVSMHVGNKEIGYLMKQPIEFYNEDREEMDKLVDAREADMKKELNSGLNGTYGKVDID